MYYVYVFSSTLFFKINAVWKVAFLFGESVDKIDELCSVFHFANALGTWTGVRVSDSGSPAKIGSEKLRCRIETNSWRRVYIVTCHLPRCSELRWCEDMGGGLPNVQGTAPWLKPPAYWVTKNTPNRILILINKQCPIHTLSQYWLI